MLCNKTGKKKYTYVDAKQAKDRILKINHPSSHATTQHIVRNHKK